MGVECIVLLPSSIMYILLTWKHKATLNLASGTVWFSLAAEIFTTYLNIALFMVAALVAS